MLLDKKINYFLDKYRISIDELNNLNKLNERYDIIK